MRRPRTATVLAWLALFAALAGTGVAAGVIRPGAVGTRELRDRAVTAAKLGRIPAARLESAEHRIPSGAPATISFARTAFDTARMAVRGRAALRAPRAGIYAIDAGLRFPADNRGIRAMFIVGPGNGYLANHEDSANTDPARSTIYSISTLARLRKGDTVSVQGFQETGEPMQLPADPRSFLAMHFVGP